MSKTPLKPVSNYEVGYGKPPRKTQFAKGQSGNPKGRPKGSKNKSSASEMHQLQKIITMEAYREIKVNGESGSVNMPIAQAVIRSVFVSAAQGNHRSQKLATDITTTVEKQVAAKKEALINSVVEYKVEANIELARREHLDVTGLDIVPHPDDIYINHKTGEVEVNGPSTYREKKSLDKLCAFRKELQDEVDDLKDRLEDSVCAEDLIFKETRIRNNEQCINELDKSLRGWICR